MDVKGSACEQKLKPFDIEETILLVIPNSLSILELFVPLIMAVIIDKGIGNQDTSLDSSSRAIFEWSWDFRRCCVDYAQYFAAKAATGFTADIETLFSKIPILLAFRNSMRWKWHFTHAFDESDIILVQNRFSSRARSIAPFCHLSLVGDCDSVCRECRNGMDVCHYSSILAVVVFGAHWTIPVYRRVQDRLDRIMHSCMKICLGACIHAF